MPGCHKLAFLWMLLLSTKLMLCLLLWEALYISLNWFRMFCQANCLTFICFLSEVTMLVREMTFSNVEGFDSMARTTGQHSCSEDRAEPYRAEPPCTPQGRWICTLAPKMSDLSSMLIPSDLPSLSLSPLEICMDPDLCLSYSSCHLPPSVNWPSFKYVIGLSMVMVGYN